LKTNEKKKNEATFAEQEAAFERSAVQTDELMIIQNIPAAIVVWRLI
jgi:hypothetical protein